MSLLRKGAIRRVGASPPPLFEDDFEAGNFSEWNYFYPDPLVPPYGTIVTSPVYKGTYSAKLYSDSIGIITTLGKYFGVEYDTLYFQSMIRLIRLPANLMYYVMTMNRYAYGQPFFRRRIWFAVDKVAGKYYWEVGALVGGIGQSVTTAIEIDLDTWYKMTLLSSIAETRKAWIGDALVATFPASEGVTTTVGYRVNPNQTPINDGFYVDEVKVSKVAI